MGRPGPRPKNPCDSGLDVAERGIGSGTSWLAISRGFLIAIKRRAESDANRNPTLCRQARTKKADEIYRAVTELSGIKVLLILGRVLL
jgi:hypothetical protein